MNHAKEELVRVTVRMTRKQKEQLDRRAEKSGVSMSEYVRNLLKKKALATEPPEALWAVLDTLYTIHDMLLRLHKLEFTEAARQLEQTVLELQSAFTEPRRAAS